MRFSFIGVAGLIAVLIGWKMNPRQFLVSYLYAYLFWFGLAIGCSLITMIHHLTGGKWGQPIRRFAEAAGATLPLLALLFVPILFGLSDLYPWARKHVDSDVLRKASYLNSVFFVIRAVFYFGIWSLFAANLRAHSLSQDETTDPTPSLRLVQLSGVGIVVVPLSATFAYIDWIMSLEPRWHSTVFPLILLAGQILVAYCFAVIFLRLFQSELPLIDMVTSNHFHELGNLILTFVLFWTYLAFSQLLIIYSANRPEEIAWYLRRIAGRWQTVIVAVALFHFFVPFLVLLFRTFKRNATVMTALSCGLLLTHLIYTCWLVVPSFPELGVSWLTFVTPIGIGGIWLAGFLWLLNRAPLVPLNDQRMKEEMAYAEA